MYNLKVTSKKIGVVLGVLILVGVLLFSFLNVGEGVEAAAGVCSLELRTECALNNIVMGLSDLTNAHGEIAPGDYNYVLCCVGAGADACTGNNDIGIFLSGVDNAHASITKDATYSKPVCSDELSCVTTTGSCPSGKIEILSLSSSTNAHLGGPGDYGWKVCCGVGGVDCESFGNRINCLAENIASGTAICTWTPVGTTANPEGGCCEKGEEWDPDEGDCGPSFGGPCYHVWAPDDIAQEENVGVKGGDGEWDEYCADVSGIPEYGFWTPVDEAY